MITSFTNIDFNKDIKLSTNIKNLNKEIINICNNLPALNIVKDNNLLECTIKQTENF